MYEYQLPFRNGPHHKGQLIKVSGTGEIAVLPDAASINMGVITENKQLIPAQKQNSEDVTKVIQSLLSLGINKSHIQTFDYHIESVYDYDQGKQIFRGYKVTHLLQITLEDIAMIGKAADTAVQNGVNYVANVQFKIKNKEAVYLQALSMALENAIEKAKTIAQTLNVTVNPIPALVVENESTFHPFPQPVTYVKGVSSTQFEPGRLMVKAAVSADFRYI